MTGMRRFAALTVATMMAAATSVMAATAAYASGTIEEAAADLGLGSSYWVSSIAGTGDIAAELQSQVDDHSGPSGHAHLIYIPSGRFTLSTNLQMRTDQVYLVAEPDTVISITQPEDWTMPQVLQFSSGAIAKTCGIYGGIWDASRRATVVVETSGSTVVLSHTTIRNTLSFGVVAKWSAVVTVRDSTITANGKTGIMLQGAQLNARGLVATGNAVNGVQLSPADGDASVLSTATISDSVLDGNGTSVSGSTDGKVGHGLGLANATATVTNTSLSGNAVCGISTTGASQLTVTGSRLANNGRHGLGTTDGLKASISDSTFTKNGYNGVLAAGPKTELNLAGVQISSSKQYGISLPSGATVSIRDSLVSGSGKINIAATNKSRLNLLGGTQVTASTSHGVTLAGGSKLSISGPGNMIAKSRKDGLLLSDKGTSGRITSSVRYLSNHGIAVLVTKKAKLATVAGNYRGNKKKAVTSKGGKITKLR